MSAFAAFRAGSQLAAAPPIKPATTMSSPVTMLVSGYAICPSDNARNKAVAGIHAKANPETTPTRAKRANSEMSDQKICRLDAPAARMAAISANRSEMASDTVLAMPTRAMMTATARRA